MAETLSLSQVKALINDVVDAFPHEACSTCECFLGYVTQLKMAADPSGQDYLESFRPSRVKIHSCLGCDPCPPADHLAEYLRGTSKT